jgi:superoxide dismutase
MGLVRFQQGFQEVGSCYYCQSRSSSLYVPFRPRREAGMNRITDEIAHVPIIGIDIWEHAFYLQYKNVKPDVSFG